MKTPTTFLQRNPDVEPMTDRYCSAAIQNEYVMNDADRANNTIGTIIYDYIDPSPNYDNSA